MKRILRHCSLAVAAAIILTFVALPGSASNMSFFQKTQDYTGQFSDVAQDAWYYSSVTGAYSYGLVTGSGGKFNPSGNVTLAEAVTFAARIRCVYNGESMGVLAAGEGKAWYDGYVAYACKNNILGSEEFIGKFAQPATRAQVAHLLARALPEETYVVLNPSSANVPDVQTSNEYYSDVIKLIRSGIATGADQYGNFKPDNNINRAETAALLVRLADQAQRKGAGAVAVVKEEEALSKDEIFKKISPCVFQIRVLKNDKYFTGSGFFVEEDGTAYTTLSLIDKADNIEITTADGQKHTDIKVAGYSLLNNVAILKIQDITKFHAVTFAQGAANTNDKVFGVSGTISEAALILEGKVSDNAAQKLGTYPKAQYYSVTNMITDSDCGGAAVNGKGEVTGILFNHVNDKKENIVIPISVARYTKSIQWVSVAAFNNSFYNKIPQYKTKNIDLKRRSNGSFIDALKVENGNTVINDYGTYYGYSYYAFTCESPGELRVEVTLNGSGSSSELYLSLCGSKSENTNINSNFIVTHPLASSTKTTVKFYFDQAGKYVLCFHNNSALAVTQVRQSWDMYFQFLSENK